MKPTFNHHNTGAGRKNRDLMRRHGISVETYEDMFKQQGGVCAICGHKPDKRSLAVDHDHDSGKIRALLCNRCNLCLGYLQDDSHLIRDLASYLDSHYAD